MLGIAAEVAYRIAEFHERRATRLRAKARAAGEKAARWTRRGHSADGLTVPFSDGARP
jgi:hypothetical protein